MTRDNFPRLVVGAVDTILAFDATDNRFDRILQVPATSGGARTACIGENNKKDVSADVNWAEMMQD